jgi:hypothetical protein
MYILVYIINFIMKNNPYFMVKDVKYASFYRFQRVKKLIFF